MKVSEDLPALRPVVGRAEVQLIEELADEGEAEPEASE